MTDEPASPTEDSPTPKPAAAPVVRRVSNPRPKKTARAPREPSANPPKENPVVTTELADMPEKPHADPQDNEIPVHEQPPESDPSSDNDDGSDANESAEWPEPESAGGPQSQSDSAKRKRRRRKGKGQNGALPESPSPSSEEPESIPFPQDTKSSQAATEQRPRPPQGGQHQPPQSQPPQLQPHQQQPQQRSKVDPDLLTRKAWKIYLAEVGEEGVALIGDTDARDLSRRCFRLAEIFLEEQARRR